MEQTTLERRVHFIPATRPIASGSRPHRNGHQRVAAYCRVSTSSEEQLNSYAAQKAYYTQHIAENPDWEMAGIFADEGLSGTSMKKRAEFNRMIAACKRGRIDMILTKSLSRFARNTVDCLRIVRMLKAHGIGVIFEKENINTLTESSEFLITLFSGFAQAEGFLSLVIAVGTDKAHHVPTHINRPGAAILGCPFRDAFTWNCAAGAADRQDALVTVHDEVRPLQRAQFAPAAAGVDRQCIKGFVRVVYICDDVQKFFRFFICRNSLDF